MVRHQRLLQFKRKGEAINDEESQNLNCSNSGYYKRTRPKFFSLLLLIILSCSLVAAPLFIGSYFNFSLWYFTEAEAGMTMVGVDVKSSLCSPICSGTICCDRSGYRSDICMMKGDIRTHSPSYSIFLYKLGISNNFINYVSKTAGGSNFEDIEELQHEKIKPYTRKWEKSIMEAIEELDLISKKVNSGTIDHDCDVRHDVPAVFFSNGGYTGNVYHEFNDGIIPLYITSQHFNKKVVFVILEYHNWWITKYGDILSHLSDFPAIDFSGDNRTHCFPEAIVGLRIHDELTVASSLMENNKSIVDFRNILDKAYWPRIRDLIKNEEREAREKLAEQSSSSPSSETSQSARIEEHFEGSPRQNPKLVVLSRSGSRAITNEDLMVKMAEEIGFQVEILKPDRTTELAKIYRALNSSDVMVGVHGAAMTHFLFMRPGTVFIQVVPLGTTWAADTYYGHPARKLGLKYIGYEIQPKESSLYEQYEKDDPVLTSPRSIAKRGWEFTKKIYLDNQHVTLDLGRFRKRLHRAYKYTMSRSNLHPQHQVQ